jgi:L-lactate utilization protein LutB
MEVNEMYDKLPAKAVVEKTMTVLEARGIRTEFVQSRKQALERIRQLIPAGSEIMTGSSTTLEEIGLVDMLKSKRHEWRNLKDGILAEKDKAKQAELRKRSVTSQFFLGSVHAVAETGEIVVASASGSQLPGYTFSSDNVIWVVGAQKIVPTLDDAIKRVRTYVFPLEDAKMKKAGMGGSTIGKMLIFEREIMPRKLTLIFVNEKLGF